MPPTEDVWEAAIAEIAAANRIGVVGHVRPDGDALGSMIAIALGARAAGKDAVASFGLPFVVGSEFRFLDQSLLVPPSEFPDDLDLAIVCDTGVLNRIGSVGEAVTGARRVVVIDHHITPATIGDVRVVDPEAAATTQLVFELLKRLGWEITQPIAEALYTGLVTDTGRFQYSSTSPEVHRMAADLLAAGVEPAPIGQALYEEAAFGYFAVASRVLGEAQLDEEVGLVWALLRRDDIVDAGIAWEDAEQLIDLVRLPREAGVACLLKEVQPGVLKGSLRSRGEIDVAKIAQAFGGGGHRNASGFTSTIGVDATIKRVVGLMA